MNLRQVRKKSKSIRNVRKITKAMQLVSAIKMKKAQQLEVEGRPYRSTLTSIIEKLIGTIDVKSSKLLQSTQTESVNKPAEKSVSKTNEERRLIIFISSNKGLCGAFHVSLYRLMLAKYTDFSQIDFVSLGNKGSQFIGRMGGKVLADYSSSKFLNEVSAVFSFVLERFLSGKNSLISVIYNKYISAFKSEPVEDIFLPFVWKREEIEKKGLN